MNLQRLFIVHLGPVNSRGFLSNPDGTDRVRRLATRLDRIHRFNNPEETIVLRTECPLGVLSTENAAKWLVGSLHAKLVIKCWPELFDVRDVDAALRLLTTEYSDFENVIVVINKEMSGRLPHEFGRQAFSVDSFPSAPLEYGQGYFIDRDKRTCVAI